MLFFHTKKIKKGDVLVDRSFMNHQFLQKAKNLEEWTVSDKNKMPIDMFELMYRGRRSGCDIAIPHSTCNLDELFTMYERIGYCPPNLALHMDYQDCNFVVLDIEPNCPDELKETFLKYPAIYAERSMSGKGIHMVFSVPSNIDDFPAVINKSKIQHHKKWYEIMLAHWITFTGNQIVLTPELGIEAFEETFAELAKQQKERDDANKINFTQTLESVDHLPNIERIMELLLGPNAYKKTIDDFYGDDSRFEMGCASHHFNNLTRLINVSSFKKDHTYSLEEQAAIIYAVLKEYIPKRDKHEAMRKGMPWLLYIAHEVVSRGVASDNK